MADFDGAYLTKKKSVYPLLLSAVDVCAILSSRSLNNNILGAKSTVPLNRTFKALRPAAASAELALFEVAFSNFVALRSFWSMKSIVT